ncbi:TorF family putative porin [Kordiimonas laminariae]|uniref:TorF family putative porin n=1 Tax=Kordiimonas laminariae TaxID=2917717 RepID=UPI001FF0EC27|nr:TorF family putative porin [Kordiimonas laminariae]MCK0068861.1 TorF family putative porin [Kordiimonas laminariae]
MSIRKRSLKGAAFFSASLFITTALFSVEAGAQDTSSPFSFSGSATLTSDYRFRGLSLSDKDFAIQGGFNLNHESGFYLSTWGSSIESFNGSELELDLYGGYAGNINSNLSYNVGFIAYLYPGSSGGTDYYETYASISGSADKLSWTLGTAYAFDQDNIGGTDNIYIYGNASYPLTNSLSASASLGFEDGAFGNEKWDWSLGLSYSFSKYSLSVSYIDTANSGSNLGDAGVIASLSASF